MGMQLARHLWAMAPAYCPPLPRRGTGDIDFGMSVCQSVSPSVCLSHFGFRAITFINIKQFNSNLAHTLYIGIPNSSLNLGSIGYPIWLPGRHLGFSFPLYISRTV